MNLVHDFGYEGSNIFILAIGKVSAIFIILIIITFVISKIKKQSFYHYFLIVTLIITIIKIVIYNYDISLFYRLPI